MSKPNHRFLSFGRIAALTGNTFIELTRLRAFYVILLFALVLIGTSIFMAQWTFQQEFQVQKDVALGAMSVFTSLLAVLATARLLPQDIEDRTISTILSKPVSRFEYLLGKLAGVLLLLALSVIIMSTLFFVVLKFRELTVLRETSRRMSSAPPEQLADTLRNIRAAAFHSNICAAIIIIYVKALLLAALTLFVSTFASTSIFTTTVMALAYFIGHLQSIAREYWFSQHSSNWLSNVFLGFVTLFFPDLQSFSVIDSIAAGTSIATGAIIKLAMLGLSYTCFYLLMATAIFWRKEL